MTVNINALIGAIGTSYQEIYDKGLIPYKTKPSGFYGDIKIDLDMKKEGVFLSFLREGKILQAVEISIQKESNKNWVFPNKLPLSLEPVMSIAWIHEKFGNPDKSILPKTIGHRIFGRAEKYAVDSYDFLVSMQIRYDMNDMVKSISFVEASKARW